MEFNRFDVSAKELIWDDLWCRLAEASGLYEPDGKAGRRTGSKKTAASAAAPRAASARVPRIDRTDRTDPRISPVHSRPWETVCAEIGGGGAAGFGCAGNHRRRSLRERALPRLP
jgi:hypothetical protein